MSEDNKSDWVGINVYKVKEQREPIEIKKEEEIDSNNLRKEIEPWLTALFQSEHLSLLLGNGITSAVHDLATGNPGADMSEVEFSVFKDQIKQASNESAINTGRGNPNIEDQIRIANNLIKGLEIYIKTDVDGSKEINEELEKLKTELNQGINSFAVSILESEKNITRIVNGWGIERLEKLTEKKDNINAIDKEFVNKFKDAENKESIGKEYQFTLVQDAAKQLMNFLISFASRSATRERLNIFTTNYDRIIEYGAELAGIRLVDRFVGIINPVFRSSRVEVDMHYNPPGVRGEPRYLEGVSHFTKLHGSLDWVMRDGVVRRIALPYGADSIDKYSDKDDTLMIYPNADKDRETSEYPYVELFRDLATSLCRPNSTLVVYGYSFGDQHINCVIADMLTIPSTHLVIINWSDKEGRIKRFYENAKRPAQISLLIGHDLGDLKTLVSNYLPKPAIDRNTIKMTDILKARGIINDNQDENNSRKRGNSL